MKRDGKRGIVLERYSDYVSKYGPYPELYAVRWSDGTEHRGYLWHGLSPDTVEKPMTRKQVDCMAELVRRESKPDLAEIEKLIAHIRAADDALRYLIADYDDAPLRPPSKRLIGIARAARLADADAPEREKEEG